MVSDGRERSVSDEPAPSSPTVGTADTVNINPVSGTLPHVRILLGVTITVLVGFGVVTIIVMIGAGGAGIDAATKGSLIQSWINLAVAAVGFWLGSSASAKMRGGSMQ